jgi:pimeloyl-ACP methyl ester carboxylesterase
MSKLTRIIFIFLGLLAATVLLGPLLIPLPALEGVSPPQQLAGPDSRFANLEGLAVHYQAAGDGEQALILLHGFASSTFSWRDVMQPMADQGCQVIAYDRPGFGLTERPVDWEGENPYSPAMQQKLLLALMEHAGIERAVLVGNSAGGAAAVQFALEHPERVESLVLVDPAIYTQGGGPGWIKPLLRTPQGQRLGLLLVRRFSVTGLDFARSAWHNPERITPEIWEGYTLPLQAENWDRGLWEFTLASESPDLMSRLDELRLPVLVITGDDDRIVPTEDSIRLAQEIPGAELVVIPSCGHVPHEECPSEFLEAVKEFLICQK